MSSEADLERPRTSRGRRNYEGFPSATHDYGDNFSPRRDEKVENYEPAHTPRPRSTRQRPKSGYKVRRQQPQVVQPDMYSDDYHLYERSTSSAHYTDGITAAAAAAKLHSDSPRTSYDSSIYNNLVDHHQPSIPSPRPSSRPGSARPRTQQGQRNRNLQETPDPNWRPTSSSSRPGSANSFSRYPILPHIGSVSSRNTPEPSLFSGQITGQLSRSQQSGRGLSSPQRDPTNKTATTSLQQEFVSSREHSFVGRKYKDIHESFANKMKELSVNDDDNPHHQVSSFHPEVIPAGETLEPWNKSAIIQLPTADNDGVGLSPSTSGVSKSTGKQQEQLSMAAVNSIELNYPPLQRKVVLPDEPQDDEPRLLLAVKLPNGQRVQRHFKTSDTVLHVLRFAEFSAQLDFTDCEVVCGVPRKVFRDLSIKLSNSGLENRTVLHIQIPDE